MSTYLMYGLQKYEKKDQGAFLRYSTISVLKDANGQAG